LAKRNETLSDIQSESSVIGTLLLHPEYLAYSEDLLPKYFYNEENACFYWAIKELVEKDGIDQLDTYNISNKIHSNAGVHRTMEKYNLPDIQECVELYQTAARGSIEEYKMYAKNIKALAFRRDLVKFAQKLQVDCYDTSKDLGVLNTEVNDGLDHLTQSFLVEGDVTTIGSKVDTLWDNLLSQRNGDGTFGIPSKFDILNSYFTYRHSQLYVVVAKTKEGKSIFLMNEAVHKLINGMKVLVIDTEMDDDLFFSRLLGHLTGIPIKIIENGTYTKEQEQEIIKWKDWLKKQPLYHEYRPGITMEEVYAMSKMLKNKVGMNFLVYDYFKSNDKDTGNNYNILGAQCDFLKNEVAGKLKIPVLAAAQLNRGGDIADSYKIEQRLSVAIKWGHKPQSLQIHDGAECGNTYAKVIINRIGARMYEEDEYLDFFLDGETTTITEAVQHKMDEDF